MTRHKPRRRVQNPVSVRQRHRRLYMPFPRESHSPSTRNTIKRVRAQWREKRPGSLKVALRGHAATPPPPATNTAIPATTRQDTPTRALSRASATSPAGVAITVRRPFHWADRVWCHLWKQGNVELPRVKLPPRWDLHCNIPQVRRRQAREAAGDWRQFPAGRRCRRRSGAAAGDK